MQVFENEYSRFISHKHCFLLVFFHQCKGTLHIDLEYPSSIHFSLIRQFTGHVQCNIWIGLLFPDMNHLACEKQKKMLSILFRSLAIRNMKQNVSILICSSFIYDVFLFPLNALERIYVLSIINQKKALNIRNLHSAFQFPIRAYQK